MQWEVVRASAQWAAYGDTLGFITELTDAAGVRRRIGRDEVTTTVPWKRRVGGRYGPDMPLPVGTYSDDTQLRLATLRAIRGDGEFDADNNGVMVEAFGAPEGVSVTDVRLAPQLDELTS